MTPFPSRMPIAVSRRRQPRKTAVGRTSVRRAVPAAAALAAVGALLTGCAGTADPAGDGHAPSPDSGNASAPPGDTGSAGTPPLPAGITPATADALCKGLGDQLQSMRTYTLTPGKVTLNGVVMTWAAEHGVNLVDIARHRDKIDRTLAAQCPDVRDGVTSALEIPDVASGLVGF